MRLLHALFVIVNMCDGSEKTVMARLDRATQRPRVGAANDSIRGADAPRLGGPLKAGHDIGGAQKKSPGGTRGFSTRTYPRERRALRPVVREAHGADTGGDIEARCSFDAERRQRDR